MIITTLESSYQFHYDSNKCHWRDSSRNLSYNEKKRVIKYLSNPHYKKFYRNKEILLRKPSNYWIVSKVKINNLIEFYEDRIIITNKIYNQIKKNKKLYSQIYLRFLEILYLKKYQNKFAHKIYFYNYFLAMPNIANKIRLRLDFVTKRYIALNFRSILTMQKFNMRNFAEFCQTKVDFNEITIYEEVEEPENFHIITKDNDNYFESEEGFNLFLYNLNHVKYDKNLVKFYSKRNLKIKNKIR